MDLLPRIFSDLQNSWAKVTHATQNRKKNYDMKKNFFAAGQSVALAEASHLSSPYMCGKSINSCHFIQKRQKHVEAAKLI